MKAEEKIRLFVPGRLCLFGEHSDWAGTNRMQNASIVPGCALVTGIEQGVHALASKASDFVMDYATDDPSDIPYRCKMDAALLLEHAREGAYDAYVAGVASYMREHYPVDGVNITITQRDLPIKKGLSSSAAICVLVAQAFNMLYRLNLNTDEIMRIAYLGEQRTPSRCGRLDQACAYGVVPVKMIFDGSEVRSSRIAVKKDIHIVFADLNAHKDTIRILADLSSAYPFARGRKEEQLHELLGEDNRRITELAAKYIESGEVQKLGELMSEAQRLFDEKAAPLCPEELTAPVLHGILSDETVRALSYGGKGVGSQGDGSVQFLAKDGEAQQKLLDYLREKGFAPYALTLRAKPRIRRAIIPVAGFGTRLYPASRFVKKELLPILDRDGQLKPALLLLLEELDAAGIDEIALVIHSSERAHYEALLAPISAEHISKLTPQMQRYEMRLRSILSKLTLIEQSEARGFGHAVYQAAAFAGGEPVLLLLGDTIYRSKSDKSCIRQLLDAFEEACQTTVALQRIDASVSERYGVFSGCWENEERTLMRCNRIVEKPSPAYAREELSMEACKRSGANERDVYGAFGAYALMPEVFERLEYAIDLGITNAKGEVELTDALTFLAENSTVMGFVPDAISYDLGNSEAYIKAFEAFSKGE